MARTKKDAKILNIKLDREIHEQLEKFCEESGLTKTIAVEDFATLFSRVFQTFQRG